MTRVEITSLNINDYFSELEMYLFSFYDVAYTKVPLVLELRNNCYKITYEKIGFSFRMFLEVISPVVDDRCYTITFYDTAFKLKEPITPVGFSIQNGTTQCISQDSQHE